MRSSALHLVLRRVALGAIALAPALLMLHAVVGAASPVPYWDEWTTPGENLVSWSGGTLTFDELFSQHNENRKFFPRLLYLALAAAGGWDVRKEIALLFLTVCAIAAVFYLVLRKTSSSRVAAFVGGAAGTFLCFSPVQLENFLWGIQLELFVPGLAVLLVALTNLSALSLAKKMSCNVALALIATYTAAPGMLLWLLAVPLPSRGESWRSRRTLLLWGIYLLCASAAIGAYFVGFERPAVHPQLLAGHPGIPELAHYITLWVGSYFESYLVPPLLAGGFALALSLLCLCTAGAVVTRRPNVWRAFYPAALLAAYASATAAMTAVARIGFGVEQALAFRYRPYSLFFYLAIVALLFAIGSEYRAEASQSRRSFRIAPAVAASLALFAWLACWIDGRTQQQALAVRNRTLLHALQWSEAMPNNPDLKFLFPRPEVLRQTVASLRARSVLPLPLVAPELVAKLSQAPAELEKTRIGRLETCAFDAQGRLGVSGRVKTSAGQKPLTHVVFGATDSTGIVKLFAVTPLRRESAAPDELCFARSFSPAHVAPGEFTILAWAIDSTNENAYPLASANSHAVRTRFATH